MALIREIAKVYTNEVRRFTFPYRCTRRPWFGLQSERILLLDADGYAHGVLCAPYVHE